jgi:hypothetical protein
MTTTNPSRFAEYVEIGRTLAKLTDATRTPMPFKDIDRLLSALIELPDGRLAELRDLTVDDFEAISDYVRMHADNVTAAANGLN